MGIFSSHFYPGNTETNCDTETEGKIFSLFMYLPIHSFIVLPSKNKQSKNIQKYFKLRSLFTLGDFRYT